MATLEFSVPAAFANGERLRETIEQDRGKAVTLSVAEDVLRVAADNLTEADRAPIQTLIDNHSSAPTEEELRPSRVRQKIQQRITALETAAGNWPTMTTTQRNTWMADNFDDVLLGIAKMARLLLNQFDVPEA